MKRVKRKKPLEGVVFGPASLERIPPNESARAPAAVAPLAVEPLKTARQPKKRRCPLCGVRPTEAEVQIGPVTVGVCGECAAPVLHGMALLDSLKRFL